MGWLSLIVVYQLAIKLAIGDVTLLRWAGSSIRWGYFLRVCKRIPVTTTLSGGFVLGGGVCHFTAIYLYVGRA